MPITNLSLSTTSNYDCVKVLAIPADEQATIADEFVAHQRLFGFQSDNVRNQYEHLCFLIQNARDRYGTVAYEYLHNRIFSNYRRWVSHINAQRWCFQRRIRHAFNDPRYGPRNQLQDMVLWLLIWGEGANCRHMPEFLCFLFFRMSQQRTKVIESGNIEFDHSSDEWYRRAVIEPTYNIISSMQQYYRNNGTLKDHNFRPHYDDMNEFFWRRTWIDAGMNYHNEDVKNWWGNTFVVDTIDLDPKTHLPTRQVEGAYLEAWRKDNNRKQLKTFIERRSWLNLWRSFDRIVELHLFALHVLILLSLDLDNWSNLYLMATAVLTLAGVNFITECLEVYFYWGVLWTLGLMLNLLIRIIVKGGIVLIGVYLVYAHFNMSNDYGNIFLYAAAAYLAARVLFELVNIQTSRWLRKLNLSEDKNFESRVASQVGFRRFYQLLFWILLFGAKLVVSYYSYISPLIGISRTLLSVPGWAGSRGLTTIDQSSYSNYLLIVALWIPTLIIYFVDTQIFYSTSIVFIGLILGVRDRVAYIRSWSDLRRKWVVSWARGARKFFGLGQMQAVTVANSVGQINTLKLPVIRQPPWHLIHIMWKKIIEEMRASDMISYHDEQMMHFGYFSFTAKPPPAPAPQPGQPPIPPRPNKQFNFYFLPSFVTSGAVTAFTSLISATEESYRMSTRQQRAVEGEIRTLLSGNETMRTALDEIYIATSCLLRVFVAECTFDPTEGNKLIECAIRQKAPASFINETLKLISASVTECIGISFDMGFQSIVRKRPSPVDGEEEFIEPWMDRAAEVNTKSFVTGLQKLYKVWWSIENGAPIDKAQSLPNPTIAVSQLDGIENNGCAVLVRVLYHLISTAAVDARPHNAVITDRLMFFLSSLSSDMPNRHNSIKEQYSWTVLTPYVDEIVLYTNDELATPNVDGVTQEFYLQCLFRKEFMNFVERMSVDPRGQDPEYYTQQKREWCSYRGQTLLRTVRGMMFYERATRLLAMLEFSVTGHPTPAQDESARQLARRKFSYVLSCQKYGAFCQSRQKRDRGELVDRKLLPEPQRRARKQEFDHAQKADDIELMLRKWPHLRVAYVDERTEANGVKVFYSVLVKAKELTNEELAVSPLNDSLAYEYGVGGDIEEVYRIRLPGSILLGEGKPENQNHAYIFTRGEFTEAIDMNQDNYFEEALKMRNLLEEFDPYRLANTSHQRDDTKRPNPCRKKGSFNGVLQCAILGFHEHIFTANLMSVGTYMSLMEATFVSITLRAFSLFASRMHYGHPDLMDKLFFMSRGGVSKSVKMLHVSEDIFAGFKATLRDGRIFHREYIQCGKGRDLGFNQLYLFEAKLASGAGEQAISREVYRMGRYLDLPRLLSFFYGAVGFYTTTTLLVLSIMSMILARVLLAVTGVDYLIATGGYTGVAVGLLNASSIYQLGLLLTLPMLAEIALEHSLVKAGTTFVWMMITGSPLFFFFHMLTKSFYFNQSLLYGGAKYRGTGRGFVLNRESFDAIYRRYARSHVYPAMKILFLLIVYGIFYSAGNYFEAMWAGIFFVTAWLIAPLWFNPLCFDHDKVLKDFNSWKRWLNRVSEGEEESWQAWWVVEHEYLRHMPDGTKRLNIFLNIIVPLIIIVCTLSSVQITSYSSVLGLIIALGGSLAVVFLYAFIGFCCKPVGGISVAGDTWRYIKLLLLGTLIVLAIVVIVFPPSNQTVTTVTSNNQTVTNTTTTFQNSHGQDFAVYLIVILLAINMVCKVLVYFGAGPYRFSFVLTWFRCVDGLFGLVIYIPWFVLSLFDFVSSIQTRLLYNLAFTRGLQVQTLVHGSASGASKRALLNDNKDSYGLYKRPASRFGSPAPGSVVGDGVVAERSRAHSRIGSRVERSGFERPNEVSIRGRRSRIGFGPAVHADGARAEEIEMEEKQSPDGQYNYNIDNDEQKEEKRI